MPASPSVTMTPSMTALLNVLCAESGSNVNELAERAGLGRSTAARVLTILEKEGLARRERTERGGERVPDLWFAASVPADPDHLQPVESTGASGTAEPGETAARPEPECDSASQDTDGDAHEEAESEEQPEHEPELALSPTDPDEDEDGRVSQEPEGPESGSPQADAEQTGESGEQVEPGPDDVPGEPEPEVTAESEVSGEDAGEPAVSDPAAAEPGASAEGAAGEEARGAAVPGTGAPRLVKGGLRALVVAHLAAHPGEDFTASKLGRALERSSGAVANALDTLVKLGQAEMTCEKPRAFRHRENAGS